MSILDEKKVDILRLKNEIKLFIIFLNEKFYLCHKILIKVIISEEK